MATIASGRAARAFSGVISGSGLAMAKMIGLSAIDLTMSAVTAPATETPKKTSAPFIASSSVRSLVSIAWADFHWFMPASRPAWITPSVSHSVTWSCATPMALRSSMQAIPAAPAPLATMRTFLMSRPVMSSALIIPAAAMMAVPCWSS